MLIGDKTRLVMFDWSGTISDDRNLVYEADRRLIAHYNLPVKSFSDFFKHGTGELVSSMRKLGITTEMADDKTIRAKTQEYFEEVIKEGIKPTIYPYASETIERLFYSGRKIVIISTHPQHMLERESKEYGIRYKIDGIKGGLKSKSQTLVNTCEDLNTSRENAVYIGDMEFDLLAAKDANIRFIGTSHGYHSKERLQSRDSDVKIIDNLIELLN